MILITAATGQVGREAINGLIATGAPLRALVRDPAVPICLLASKSCRAVSRMMLRLPARSMAWIRCCWRAATVPKPSSSTGVFLLRRAAPASGTS
jgi:hypothetical protein